MLNGLTNTETRSFPPRGGSGLPARIMGEPLEGVSPWEPSKGRVKADA
jgi:hypothetical protein